MQTILNNVKKLIFGSQTKQVEPDYAWRVPNPKSSDIYLVSYPKSGNTWLRYLMTYAIWPELTEPDLVEMASYIPSYGLEHDKAMMLDANAPCNLLKHRLIKEHAMYNELSNQYIKRAIYIVRDGRDAIVSYWHYCNQKNGTSIPFIDFIELSARPDHYGPWKKHVLDWLNAPLEAKLVLRYEDMIADTSLCLRRALEFAEFDVDNRTIENAVKKASFDSMKTLEKTKGFNLEHQKNVEFVRRGKVGGWRDMFSDYEIEQFNKFHGGLIPQLNYQY